MIEATTDTENTEPRETLGPVAAAALRLATCQNAIKSLRLARTGLRTVGADAAADAVGRALKSTEGAERHAWRLFNDARNRAMACER